MRAVFGGSWFLVFGGVAAFGCSDEERDSTSPSLYGAGGLYVASGGLSNAGGESPSVGGVSVGMGGALGVGGGPTAGSGGAVGGGGDEGGGGTVVGTGGTMIGTGGDSPVDGGAAGSTNDAAAGAAGADSGSPSGPMPIDDPVADDCITDVSPGDHTFTCQGLNFQVMVDQRCTEYACGLIADLHGAAMSGEIMRNNNRLHELAPEKGYLVIHPTANGGAWDLVRDPLIVEDFMKRMIRAFHADEKRIHMTGFSMGSGMTFWFLCNRPAFLASAGPVTGSSADQVRLEGTNDSCIQAIDSDWQPRVPILFMSGRLDSALSIEAARARTDGIVSRLGLTGGDEIDGDSTYSRKRWEGEGGMVFDFLEHGYSSALLAGHCIPGGSPTDAIFSCTSGGNSLSWGETVLEWFVEHPKP